MTKLARKEIQDAIVPQQAPLATPTDLKHEAARDIVGAMNASLADVFSLYLNTKNFHWHMSGPNFRDDRPDRRGRAQVGG